MLCVDEKPQIQALTGTAPVLPMRPGQPERRTHDYGRQGTTDLFDVLDIQTGTVIGRCTRRHRSDEFRAFLDQVELSVPSDLDVHLVLDNAATHKTKLIHDWLLKRPRWHLHFTPTSASWLNLVEGWFALLTRQRLQRGVFEQTDDLEAAIHAHIAQTNDNPNPSSGPKLPTSYSSTSDDFAKELLTQTTSSSSSLLLPAMRASKSGNRTGA